MLDPTSVSHKLSQHPREIVATTDMTSMSQVKKTKQLQFNVQMAMLFCHKSGHCLNVSNCFLNFLVDSETPVSEATSGF